MSEKNSSSFSAKPKRNTLKGRTGLARLWNATRYSRDGFCAAYCDEQAFRQIACVAVVGLPLACILGRSWVEVVVLVAVLLLALIVELLNSAIENVVDRISLELHPLAKKAKDMGSAAQFVAQSLIVFTWGTFLCSLL
ncbi:MAG: diacylglycerol kinase [Desulfovibrionaceae bacterium]|nr:diacylglycerol kinase [Desulfovibrionaceae bacterium]